MGLREAAAQSAQSIYDSGQSASPMQQDTQSQGALEALLAALMFGLATITETQLRVAAREVLRLAGSSENDSAVDQLCQQMRSAHTTAALYHHNMYV